jgi:hypothetical protein
MEMVQLHQWNTSFGIQFGDFHELALVAYETGLSRSVVWPTLHEKQVYPFHI